MSQLGAVIYFCVPEAFFFFLHAAIKEPLKSILQLTTNASHRKLNMALSPLLNGVILRAKKKSLL